MKNEEAADLISLEEWLRQFPPGTHMQGCAWRRVTPRPALPPMPAEYPQDMTFDWPPRLIMGRIGVIWDES